MAVKALRFMLEKKNTTGDMFKATETFESVTISF